MARVTTVARDVGNVEAAVTHAIPRDPQSALELVGAMLFYLKGRGAATAGLPLCSRTVASTPDTPTRARARALLTLGVTAMPLSQMNAGAVLEEAIEVAHATGDEWAEAYAQAFHGLLLTDRGDAEGARAAVETAITVAAALGDPVLDGLVALARGWLQLAEGRLAEAIATMWPVRRLGGDLHQHHFIEMYIGFARFRLGDLGAAARHFCESVRIAIPLGHVRGAAGGIEGCAYIDVKHGRHREAAILLGAAQGIRMRTIPLFRWWLGHHDEAMAAVRAALGEQQLARCLEEGARMHEEDAINATVASLARYARQAMPP